MIKKQKITIEVKTKFGLLLEQELIYMKEKQMKEMAWNTFKKTGSIDTFLELVEIQNTLENGNKNEVKNIGETQYGNYQNQGNYPFGK